MVLKGQGEWKLEKGIFERSKLTGNTNVHCNSWVPSSFLIKCCLNSEASLISPLVSTITHTHNSVSLLKSVFWLKLSIWQHSNQYLRYLSNFSEVCHHSGSLLCLREYMPQLCSFSLSCFTLTSGSVAHPNSKWHALVCFVGVFFSFSDAVQG